MTLAVPLPTLPFTDPVLVTAVAMVVFLVVPLLFERFGVPGINHRRRGSARAARVRGPGAGPHHRAPGHRRAAVPDADGGTGAGPARLCPLPPAQRGLGLASALIPGVIGTAAALALGYSTPSALLVGSAFASHTLLAYPIASRLGIVRNEAVNVTLGGTIRAEILALVLLAVVVGSSGRREG